MRGNEFARAVAYTFKDRRPFEAHDRLCFPRPFGGDCNEDSTMDWRFERLFSCAFWQFPKCFWCYCLLTLYLMFGASESALLSNAIHWGGSCLCGVLFRLRQFLFFLLWTLIDCKEWLVSCITYSCFLRGCESLVLLTTMQSQARADSLSEYNQGW